MDIRFLLLLLISVPAHAIDFIIPHSDTAPKFSVALVHSTTGAFLTGLTFETASLVISCRADTAATWTDYASTTDIETITTIGTYADPGAGDIAFSEIESEGVYEIHLDDALVATMGARYIYCKFAGAANLLPREVSIYLDVLDSAGVETAARAAIVAEDVPSNTELNARSLAAAAYATEANQQTILTNQSELADGTTKVEINGEGWLNCEVNTANFAGSTTSFACILTDLAGGAVTKDSGDLSGKAILVLSGAQIDEGRYIGENATTWDGANSELQVTVQRALPGTLADAVTVRIY